MSLQYTQISSNYLNLRVRKCFSIISDWKFIKYEVLWYSYMVGKMFKCWLNSKINALLIWNHSYRQNIIHNVDCTLVVIGLVKFLWFQYVVYYASPWRSYSQGSVQQSQAAHWLFTLCCQTVTQILMPVPFVLFLHTKVLCQVNVSANECLLYEKRNHSVLLQYFTVLYHECTHQNELIFWIWPSVV